MRTKTNLQVGFHVPITDSIDLSNDRAKEIGCTAFQIFTRNPQGWKYKELSEEGVKDFRRKFRKFRFKTCITHMPYLPNISSPDKAIYRQSVKSLTVELERCAKLDIPLLVTHMGSHRGKGIEIGLKQLTNACNQALDNASGKTRLLLENMAGGTNSVGSDFKNIQQALEGIEEESRIGVCIDTCHAFAAGYDLSSQQYANETLEELNRTIGFNRVFAMHLNDSKGALGSHLDRHEHIGMGSIGELGFRAILKNSRVKQLPLIMETPVDDRRDDKGNLLTVLRLAK